jgi:hypothetical protein
MVKYKTFSLSGHIRPQQVNKELNINIKNYRIVFQISCTHPDLSRYQVELAEIPVQKLFGSGFGA